MLVLAFAFSTGAVTRHCQGNRFQGYFQGSELSGISPDIGAFCHRVISPDYSDNSNGDLAADTGNDVTLTSRGEMWGGANTHPKSRFGNFFVSQYTQFFLV
jgi:hypothetical protein